MPETRAGRSTKRFQLWEKLKMRSRAFVVRIKQNPDQERRVIAGFVGIVGVLAVFFGYLGIRHNLREPYAYLYEDISKEDVALIQQEIQKMFNSTATSEEILKTKDTDQDGLNDYDELYVYFTSPYLQDTDGDSYKDKEEADSGNNPNCPSEEECGARVETTTGELPDPATATPAQIKEALIAAGIDATALEFLNDDDLVALYKETVTETGLDITEISPDTIAEKFAEGEGGLVAGNLEADDLRQLLPLTGEVTLADLEGIDDETLLKTYQQVIQDQYSESLKLQEQTNSETGQ